VIVNSYFKALFAFLDFGLSIFPGNAGVVVSTAPFKSRYEAIRYGIPDPFKRKLQVVTVKVPCAIADKSNSAGQGTIHPFGCFLDSHSLSRMPGRSFVPVFTNIAF
jgi:hypothetical protein